MKRLDPILLTVILVMFVIFGAVYFAQKKWEHPVEVPWKNRPSWANETTNLWTTNLANPVITNRLYPDTSMAKPFLTISATNRDIVTPGAGSMYLIRFTDTEWELLTNHYPRYTNSIQTFKFYADVTNNPSKP